MNNAQELDFAYKVRHALNERTDDLPTNVTENLASSRKIAISRKKKDSPLRVFVRRNVFAGQVGAFFGDPAYYWLSRVGALLTVAALLGGLSGIYHAEKQRKLHESAEIDIAVVSDELPPSAYLDNGFKAYLDKRGT
ncbi:MAG: hypothetical protein H6R04_2067 [Burkholderiaceae bacterium]|nr:hypothetical protein [Burkholderiaceae bacterium]